jgi:hypothetical protein
MVLLPTVIAFRPSVRRREDLATARFSKHVINKGINPNRIVRGITLRGLPPRNVGSYLRWNCQRVASKVSKPSGH